MTVAHHVKTAKQGMGVREKGKKPPGQPPEGEPTTGNEATLCLLAGNAADQATLLGAQVPG